MIHHLSKSEKIGLGQVFLASFFFGFLGIFGKLAFQNNLSVGTLLTGRFALAAILMGLYFVFLRPQKLKIGWLQFGIATLQGLCGYALFSTFYFKALEGISVSLAAMLLFTYPLWIAILHALPGAPMKKSQWLVLASALGGLVVLLWGNIEVRSLMAFLYGLGAGVTYAIYIFVSGKVQKQVDPMASSFYVILWAAVALAVFHHPEEQSWKQVFMNLEDTQGWIILGMAILTTILPLTLILSSLQRLPSSYVALVSMLEPVTATFAGWMILHESLSWNQLLGSMIVLGAVIFQVRGDPTTRAALPIN